MKKISIIGVLMGAAMLCAISISLNQSPDKGLSISLNSAEARIGRPLTPGSVAGVNRRVAPQHDGMITQALMGCGAGRVMVNGACVARTIMRHARRCARWNGGVCAHYY